MIKMIKKLIKKLGQIFPGYLAYCEDCGHLKELIYFKDNQKFMCRQCIDRYAKLYMKMETNKAEIDREKNRRYIGQVV